MSLFAHAQADAVTITAASWLEPVRPSVRPVSLLRAPSRVTPGHDQGLHVGPHAADPHHAASLPASLDE